MYTYIFSGVIHPQRVNFSLDTKLSFVLKHSDFGINGQTTLEFRNSRFTAIFDSEIDYTESGACNLETLKNFVEQNIRLVVDIYCYVKSYSYDVGITKVQCKELDIDYTFSVRGEWNINKSKQETNEEFTKIFKLFDRPERVFLKDVLADFRRSIKYPDMTAFFCFRAIETIRKFCFEDDRTVNEKKRIKQAWENLRSRLCIPRHDFERIEGFAFRNRHGVYPVISYKEREKIMNFTRELINKVVQMLENR